MARIDPVKKARKWASKLGAATQDYIDGINGVTESPAQAAIAQQAAMLTRFRQAVERGDWAAALNAVGLNDWKQAAVKGAPNLANGATKGEAKMVKYLQKAAPEYDRIRAEIRSMPNGTDAERKARMDRNLELMKAMKGIKDR